MPGGSHTAAFRGAAAEHADLVLQFFSGLPAGFLTIAEDLDQCRILRILAARAKPFSASLETSMSSFKVDTISRSDMTILDTGAASRLRGTRPTVPAASPGEIAQGRDIAASCKAAKIPQSLHGLRFRGRRAFPHRLQAVAKVEYDA